VSGPDIGDTVIAPPPRRPYVEELGAPPGRLRIGLLDHYPHGDSVHVDCAEAARNAARLLEDLGHHVEPAFPAPLADLDVNGWIVAVASSYLGLVLGNLEDVLGREAGPDDVEPATWALAQAARRNGAVEFVRAQANLVGFRRAMHRWWADGYDLLLTPTTGEPPARLGLLTSTADAPLAHRALAARYSAFTRAFNFTGQPAISVPLHWTAGGLPVGVQLVAAYGREDLLIGVAAQLEQAQPWADRRPPQETHG